MAEWLDETYGLAATRAGEYMRETGSLPGRELMDMYQAEKRRRLEAYERDPEGFLLRPREKKRERRKEND